MQVLSAGVAERPQREDRAYTESSSNGSAVGGSVAKDTGRTRKSKEMPAGLSKSEQVTWIRIHNAEERERR